MMMNGGRVKKTQISCCCYYVQLLKTRYFFLFPKLSVFIEIKSKKISVFSFHSHFQILYRSDQIYRCTVALAILIAARMTYMTQPNSSCKIIRIIRCYKLSLHFSPHQNSEKTQKKETKLEYFFLNNLKLIGNTMLQCYFRNVQCILKFSECLTTIINTALLENRLTHS